jgi:hypothetical protein
LQSDSGAFAPQLARERLLPVAFLKAFVQLALSELDHALAEQRLLFAQAEFHHAISFRRW